jgi:hypothetical protein
VAPGQTLESDIWTGRPRGHTLDYLSSLDFSRSSGLKTSGSSVPESRKGSDEPALGIIAAVAQHADKLSKITLRGGVIGRITWIIIFVCLSAMGMTWSVRSEWVTFFGLAAMFGTVLVLGLKALKFAENNPQTALMEGAELLIHEQMKLQMGMKSQPTIDPKPLEDVSEPPRHPELDSPEITNLPDESPVAPPAVGVDPSRDSGSSDTGEREAPPTPKSRRKKE